ncbi:MAG: GNAT family N-acetyltransferase [Gemmatimonadaceae bacterium]
MPVQLRAATASDADVIARLFGELGYPVSSTDLPGRLATVIAEGGAVILASEGSGTLGMMCLARHNVLHAPGPVAYITALVTIPEARRGGIGRALVEAAVEWARRQRCVRLSVTSAEHREDAHAFYPKCGLPFSGRRFSMNLDYA